MAILKGIFVGALSGPLAVASVGALLGYVGGWAPCHGVPYSVGGAYFGFYIFLALFGPPAGIVGAIVGGVAGSRQASRSRRTPGAAPVAGPLHGDHRADRVDARLGPAVRRLAR